MIDSSMLDFNCTGQISYEIVMQQAPQPGPQPEPVPVPVPTPSPVPSNTTAIEGGAVG